MAERIPFGPVQQSGYDELAGASPSAINVVMDGTGTVRRRPGLKFSSYAPSTQIDPGGISALHFTSGGNLYAVGESGAERKLYLVSPDGALSLTERAGEGLDGTGRPVLAETELLLVLAGGGQMQKVVLENSLSSRLGGEPPIASHVVANAGRLLANDLTVDPSKIRFSGIALGNGTYAGHELWSQGVGTAGFVSGEARPDPVVGLYETLNEVLAFGTTSLQAFAPDPSLVYATTSKRDFGCGSPHSVVAVDNVCAWLDHARRFVLGDARENQVIGAPIKATLDTIADPSGCFGYRALVGNTEAFAWTFPQDSRTFVYAKGGGWSQWQGAGGPWEPLNILSHHLVNGTGVNLVGTRDGYIAELSDSATTDLGEPIAASVTTGYVDRGTSNPKLCRWVTLTLRRGTTQESVGEQARLRWRDRPGPWEGTIPVDLGRAGDTEIVVPFHGLGVYRRRQWQFEFSGQEALTLVSAMEQFEVLDL